MNRKLLRIFALLSVFKLTQGIDVCDDPIARTTDGLIRGICRQSEDKNTFISFLGVEYAEQPVGERRFRDVQPKKPYNYIFNATKDGKACPQNSTSFSVVIVSRAEQSEACLNANIHVPLKAFPGLNPSPAQKARPLLPIFFYIHGGGYGAEDGSTNLLGAEYLIDEDIIVITFNYRLQVFGFLYLNTPEFPGNLGLRDMLTCLRWVKANAKNFGGDPDNITIGGQSVGGVTTHMMMLSKATRGLFKRAIIMSGVAIRGLYSTSAKSALKSAHTFLSALNITTSDSKKIRAILLKKSVSEILMASAHVKEEYYNDILLSFGPVVETQFTQEVILDDDPKVLVDQGRGKDYPAIIGFTNNEYQFFKPSVIGADYLDLSLENPLLILSPDLTYRTDNATANKLGAEVENIYFNGRPTLEKLLTILTSTNYRYPAIHLALKRKQIGGARTYLYRFSYDPDVSTVKQAKNITYCGAAHFEDLTFVFKSNIFNDIKGFSPSTAKDQRMIKQMTGYFKNFMVCSKPICDSNSQSLWPPICRNTKTVMFEDICQPGVYHARPLTSRMKNEVELFDSIFSRVENS